MNEKELYEKHYEENKLKTYENLLPRWRKMLKSFDLHREELALSLLEGGEKFLDVGCGNGSLAFKTSKKFTEVYGVDICETSIRDAKQSINLFTGESKFYFHVCNINEKVDFPDRMFDAVTSIAVIEHVFDPYCLVREVHRVLKPGGIFVAQVPNIAYLKHRIWLLMGQLPVTAYPYNFWTELGWDGGHLHYFTKKTFCGLFEDCGFSIKEVSGSGLLAKFRNFYPALLTGDIFVKAKKC